MAIDLKKNKDSLLKAYNAIVNDKDNTDWAVFGYEGQTCTLKVVETGDGGLDEMKDDLNSGKIMYGYCRVTDPNTNLYKFVLINWQGEGAPDLFRLRYSTHLRDVQAFFKSIHVTVNARTDDDVDSDVIITKVAKSSGSNYSFHKEKPCPVEEPTPVGTNYQRTRAAKDINNKSRDKFWAGTEKDETARIEENKKKSQEEALRLDNERKERESREAKTREQAIQEKMQRVSEHKRAEQLANATNKEEEKRRWEQDQREILSNDDTRRKQSEHSRKQRAAEAVSLVGSRTSGTRSMFEEKSRQVVGTSSNTGPPPPRKLKSTFLENQPQEESARKQPIEIPQGKPTYEPEADSCKPEPVRNEPEPDLYKPEPELYKPEPVRNEPEPDSYEPEPVRDDPQPAFYEPEESPYEIDQDLEPVPEANPACVAPADFPKTRNLLQETLPKRQASDEEEDDQHWDESTQENVSPPSQPIAPSEVCENTTTNVVSSNSGLSATAIYDYQADDETEISFDPGEIISDIEQIDDGWWLGTAPNGHHGMFPANYVEINE